MNILILTNNPDRASFRQRIEAYFPTLGKSGFDYKVIRLPKGLIARKNLIERCNNFDIVFLHKKTLNPVDSHWLHRHAQKIVYDFDDAIMYSAGDPEKSSRKRLNAFKRTVERADLVTAGNAYLADHAKVFNANVHILPTGLAINSYQRTSGKRNNAGIRLVWIGSRSTLKYLAQIEDVLNEIGRRYNNTVLRIISDEFISLKNLAVERCTWSLTDQATDLVSSDIGLAPLPDNRFTRGKCGFKILQYQAAGLPTVASPVGVNSEYVDHEVNGFLAQGQHEWVDKLSRLIDDSQLRNQLGSSGRESVKRFDLNPLGERLCELLESSL